MKKITLLLTLFYSILSFGQLEDFEGTWPPPGWAITTGTGFGGSEIWHLNTDDSGFLGHSPTHAAYVNRENVGQNNTEEDWLIMNERTVPTDGQLRFWTRQTIAGIQGTIYQIRVSTGAQMALGDYTILQTYTEDQLNDLNATTLEYEEKAIDFPAAYIGQEVFVAFVRVFTQTGLGVGGDRWLVDDVDIVQKCKTPSNLDAPLATILSSSALLTFDNNSISTNFEIEVLFESDEQTGVATHTGTGSSLNVTGLLPGTCYQFYVRSVCPASPSEWAGPRYFCTLPLGSVCADPITISGTPYQVTGGITGNYGDEFDTPQGSACGATPAGTNYLQGNEVFYDFVPTVTGVVSMTMTPVGTASGNSSIFVYSGCSNVGVSCIAGMANAGTTVRAFNVNVVAGQHYIIVISSAAPTPATQSITYNLLIQSEDCQPKPTNGAADNVTTTSAELSWISPGITSWEVAVQPLGSGIPDAGTDTDYYSGGLPYLADGLNPATQYQFWVRSECGVGSGVFSSWAGPYPFNTLLCVDANKCNYTFIMTDTGSNGWGTGRMQIRQAGIFVAEIGSTFTSGAGPVPVTVPLCENLPFELVWTAAGAGAQASQTRIRVENSFGQTVYAMTAATPFTGQTLFSDTVLCDVPECDIAPVNVALSNFTTSGFTINWTAPATTSWDIFILPAGSTPPTAFATPTYDNITVADPLNPSFTTTAPLIPDTCYDVYVRVNCEPFPSAYSVKATGCTLPSCYKPIAPLTVTGQTLNSAILDWANDPAGPTPDSWEILLVPGPTLPPPPYTPEVTDGILYTVSDDAPFEATGLDNAQVYYYYIRSVCPGDDKSQWAGPIRFNTLLCLEEEKCDYKFVLTDEGGNGWNGAKMQVRQNDIFVAELVMTSGSTKTQIVKLCHGESFEVIWTVAGTQPGEVGLQIQNPFLDVLYTKQPGTGTPLEEVYSATTNCINSPCAKPTDVVVVTGPTTATITVGSDNSTPPSGLFDLYVVETGGDAPINDPATAPTHENLASGATISGLTPSTSYTFYIRADCGGGVTSTWTILTPIIDDTTPLNNDCQFATPIPVNPGQVCIAPLTHGVTYGATASTPTGGTAACAGTDDDIWFSFVATQTSQTLTFSALDSTPAAANINHAVYSGACDALVELYCTPNESSTPNNLTIGQTYFVRVYTTGTNPAHSVEFDVCITSPPVNDDCIAAIPVTVNSGQTCVAENQASGDTFGATASNPLLDPVLTGTGCGPTNNDIWYSFVATHTTHTILLSDIVLTPSTATSIKLNHSVFSGSCAGLTKLYCATANTSGATGLVVGNTYYIRVYTATTVAGQSAAFKLCIISPPVNDDCALPTPIPVNAGQTCVTTVSGNTFGSTASMPFTTPPVPAAGCSPNGNDVWYSFVATSPSHSITISNVVPTPSTATTLKLNFSVFSGDCTTLTKLLCSTTHINHVTGLTIGETYRVRVYLAVENPEQSATFDICVTSPPVNNECAAAIPVTVNSGQECMPVNTVSGNTFGATASLPLLTPPLTGAGCGPTNNDIWYSFVATAASHSITLSNIVPTPATATTLKLNFSVFSGDCGLLTKLLCSTTNINHIPNLTIGNTYYVRVYTATTVVDQSATFDLCITSPPVNDNCANAIPVTVNANQNCLPANSASGNTFGATASLPILTPPLTGTGCGPTNNDIWYSFVATSTSHGITLDDVLPTPLSATIKLNYSVFSGTCSDLTKIYCSTTNYTNALNLTVGQTYYIRVYTATTVVDQFVTFKLCITSPPVNDECANAIDVPVNADQYCNDKAFGSTVGAGLSTPTITGAGCTGTNDDVWYKFVATNDIHFINVNTLMASSGTVALNHAVFTGVCGTLVTKYCSTQVNSVATGLVIGQTYYVRVYTLGTTIGDWATFSLCIKTPPPPATNDTCATALPVQANVSSACDFTTPGTIIGATPSVPAVGGPACVGNANDDVWFSFVATVDRHFINLINVEGTTTDLNHAVYSGSCGTLTNEYCSTAGNLTGTSGNFVPGQTYYIRVWSNSATAQTVMFDVCIKTVSTCETATPFCGSGATQSLLFPNTVGVPSPGQVACLGTAPNPTYYYLQVGETGNLEFEIRQSTDPNNFPNAGAPGIDVDYVAWGPFDSPSSCDEIVFGDCPSCPNNTTNPDFYPFGNIVDCSYDAAPVETLHIPNAVAGEYYLLLLTNFNTQPGYIKLFQSNFGEPGTGVSENLCCDANAGPDLTVCAPSVELNALLLSEAAPTQFQWYFNTGIIPGAESSTYTATESGLYKVVATCGLNQDVDEINVTLLPAINPTPAAPYVMCEVAATDGTAPFDLTTITPEDLGLDPLVYGLTFHTSVAEAEAADPDIDTTVPFVSPTATIYIRIERLTLSTCFDVEPLELVVSELPDAAFTYDSATYCINALADPVITITGVAGTFSVDLPGLALDTTTGAIDLATSTPGTYIVTNEILGTTANLCADVTATATVEIIAAPVATFDYAMAAYCSNATDPAPTAVGLGTFGVFTADPATLIIDPATGVIDLSASPAGTYIVYNTHAAANGCEEVKEQDTVTITTLPDALFSYASTQYCLNDPDPAPIFTTGVAGEFTANSTLLIIDSVTGIIDLSASAAGVYTIKNTIEAADGCGDVEETFVVTLNQGGSADFTYADDSYCTDGGTVTPMFSGGAVAGTFGATPAGLSLNTSNGTIDLGASAEGVYTVTNLVAGVGACGGDTAVFTITVTEPHSGIISYSGGSFCKTSTSETVTNTAPAGGVYSAPGGLTIDIATGTINPSTSTPGDYLVEYTLTGSGACDEYTTATTVTIFAVSDITFDAQCVINDYTITALPEGGSFDPLTATYSWTGTTAMVPPNPTTQSIIVRNPGVFTVTVTTPDGCSNSAEYAVTAVRCKMQKGISPDNNNENDSFDLTGYNVKHISIFNRYGTMVFQWDNYTDEWKGQDNSGDELPDGTYFYVIDTGAGKQQTGWIYLNR